MLGEITACLWAGGNDPKREGEDSTRRAEKIAGETPLSLIRRGGGGGPCAIAQMGGWPQTEAQSVHPQRRGSECGCRCWKGRCSEALMEVIVDVLLFSSVKFKSTVISWGKGKGGSQNTFPSSRRWPVFSRWSRSPHPGQDSGPGDYPG